MAQTDLGNTVIRSSTGLPAVVASPGDAATVVVQDPSVVSVPLGTASSVPPLVPGVAIPAPIDSTLVTATPEVDRLIVQPVETDQRIIVRPVPTGEVVTGGYADVAECYEEGESPASDRDRLPACPAELADLGEINYVTEPVQQPVVEQPVIRQPAPQVQAVEPVQLDLASVTRGTPCGPGTGTACATQAASLQNVRPYFGAAPTPPPPPPAPVAVAPPPPPPQVIAAAPPPPPPVAAVTPLPAAGFGGIGAAGLAAVGVGALALGGIIYAIADDDDNDSTTSTRSGGGEED